ncbi:hypothetical protein NPD5_4133 [Clostridium sporogenes]|uniref:Uncharacterized protein n=1 Tax=Clostridium sporogenes TaxID=1509 RepID=A0A1L3NK25_CLOSG|nr:hypothetical protein [Clostridium sporogenes]APH16453.1 hypothetical protein NPD5_4133 [Clostridium sporogenes]
MKEDSKYNNHISKFINYIEVKDKDDTPIVISKNDVDESIGFYHEKGKINTYSSMENYIEGVKSFSKFLVKKKYAKDIFSLVYGYQGWKEHISTKYGLNDTEEREYFNKDIIVEILSYLDDYFDNTDYNKLSGIRKKERYIKNLATRIFIKIMLIAPAKRNVIFNLNIDSFIENFRWIVVNGVSIAITNSLRRDIKHALKMSNLIHNKDYKDVDNLFMYIVARTFEAEKFNQWFCHVLKQIEFDIPKYKDTYSVEVIGNTTVYNMVKNLANPAIISKISGISLSRLEEKYYNANPVDSLIDSKINIELSKISYYQYI